ncbi:energy transducer TonB [Sphingopyxis sp. MWB1]|uniref:energy transducer TonB n=1 Tax=Sphingopyxis sp. MWB1 TaxID=1537715 RepID=UPI00068AFE01|nr:energy transducer TonB [Sphingopyxis sp. MWB1]
MLTAMVVMFLSVEEVKPVARTGVPAGNPGLWVSSADYPAAAMREGLEGTTGFRLHYNADGRPYRCEISQSSGHDILDGQTCNLLMRRARFTPGRDAKGQAAGGIYSNRIRWKIPEGELPFSGVRAVMGASLPQPPHLSPAMHMLDVAALYPPAARAAGEEGFVGMLLDIDTNGRVSHCVVETASRSDALDAASCDVMREHGRFIPARALDGKSTAGRLPVRFHWRLPVEGMEKGDAITQASPVKFPFTDPGTTWLRISVSAEGEIEDCAFKAEGRESEVPAGKTPCDFFVKGKRFTPFEDSEGRPVARQIILESQLAVEAPADE